MNTVSCSASFFEAFPPVCDAWACLSTDSDEEPTGRSETSRTAEAVWLVAEDTEDDFILLQRALRRICPDIKLIRVEDGCQAKHYLLGQGAFQDRAAFPRPNLILADLHMPRCNGFELLEWLRQQPDFGALPFVVLSSSNQPADVTLAGQYGADYYLTKPAELEQLLDVSRRLCQSRGV